MDTTQLMPVRIVGSDVPRSGDEVQGFGSPDRDEAYSLDVVLHASGSEIISERFDFLSFMKNYICIQK